MEGIRVVHYVNQFFGQIGRGEKAYAEPQIVEGAVGAALATQRALGDRGQVVATVICGDNYIYEHLEGVISTVIDIIKP